MYIENIVIGKPIVEPSTMFATNEDDWERIEKEKTYYTEERFLPRILVDIGIYPSVSEIRRNKVDREYVYRKYSYRQTNSRTFCNVCF